MMESLPPISSLSPSLVSFLNDNLHTHNHLLQLTPSLLSDLHTQFTTLDQTLTDLTQTLQTTLVSYASYSHQTADLITSIHSKLNDLRPSTSSPDGKGSDQILGEELPALAKEVARVEDVRNYAETALKLDTVIGNIEDAVSSTVSRNLRKHPSAPESEEARLFAIKYLKQAEDILTKTRPQWAHLVSAVDHRIDRALAILRPQAIADHRSLLTSLGWPPPFSILSSSNPDSKKSTEISNPLFTMRGDLKQQYCESFLALCSLQELQRQRKSRQLEGYNQEVDLYQPLWAIEELVNPISIACQRHFVNWVDKPEFIFALVYKITRDYIDSMDELLQPLVDEAMLSEYSCREEWISAMVTSLSTYLAKDIFSTHVNQLDEESVAGFRSQARTSLLHLVDLMIAFDKRVHTLVSQSSGISLSLKEDRNLHKISSLSVFCDRPDWLDLWAETELNDTIDKLKLQVEDETSWSMEVQGASLMSSEENFKSPAISGAFLRCLSPLIDRCRSLPSISLRSRFVRVAVAPIIHKFLNCILARCQEAEGLTALTDDDALIKVTKSINAARYVESALEKLCDDDVRSFSSGEGPGSGILDEEIGKLEEFRTEWVDKLISVVLRGFDARCRDYMKNRKQWQEKGEQGWAVSKSFVGALDYLQGKMSVLEGGLNELDFVGLWRGLATGVDRLVFNGVLVSNTKFNDRGVERLGNDLDVLFGVFGAWCMKPKMFFLKLSEGLKLLKMEEMQVDDSSVRGERWFKGNGIKHLSASEAEKILKHRVYIS